MSKSKSRKRTFTPEFKHLLVQLYKNGKRKCDIMREYDVSHPTLSRWILEYNLATEQEISAKFQEQIQQLLMENNILKQTVLIMGQK